MTAGLTPTPTLSVAGGGSDSAATFTSPKKGEVGAKRRVGVARFDRKANA